MKEDVKLGDFSQDQAKRFFLELVQDVSTSHFMKAADEQFWKNIKTLGVETTGKDVTKVADVRCLRKTFDASQKCRITKEKQEDAVISETAKKKVMMGFTLTAMAISVASLFKDNILSIFK